MERDSGCRSTERRKEIHQALQGCFERLAKEPGDAEALRRLVELLEQVGSTDELEEFCARANLASDTEK